MTAPPTSAVDVVRIRPDGTAIMEALLHGAGPYLAPLLDVGTAANGDLLLHLPAPTARLSALLQVPGFPTRGEVVTVLVPLAEALGRLHGCGVALGSVAADQVGFDAEGAPSWAAPAMPVLRRRAGEEAFAHAVRADVDAFRVLRDGLLTRAGASITAGSGLEETVDALFRLADPVPVRLHPVAPPPEPWGPPSRLVPAAAAQEETAPASGVAAAVVAAVAVHLRSVRRRVWGAAAAVGVLFVAGVLLLPSGRADSVPTRTPMAPPSTVVATPAVVRTLGPTAAVRSLVTRRARCLTAGDEDCLRDVDAADSPALAADLVAARAGTDGVHVDPSAVRVRSAAAGTALADADGIILLAVRQPDGWRLRDVVAKPPAR